MGKYNDFLEIPLHSWEKIGSRIRQSSLFRCTIITVNDDLHSHKPARAVTRSQKDSHIRLSFHHRFSFRMKLFPLIDSSFSSDRKKKCKNIYDNINILLVNQFACGLHARTLTHTHIDVPVRVYCDFGSLPPSCCCWRVLLLFVVATTSEVLEVEVGLLVEVELALVVEDEEVELALLEVLG